MKVTFYIDYRPGAGEHLAVMLAGAAGGHAAKRVDLTLEGESSWHGETFIDDHYDGFSYSYAVVSADGDIRRREYGPARRVVKTGNIGRMARVDRWHDIPADKPFYSTVFTDCVNRRQDSTTAEPLRAAMLSLRVEAPCVGPDMALAVSGNIEALGCWNPEKAVRMADGAFPAWECQIPVSAGDTPIEYKFLIVDRRSGAVVEWEKGDNRRLTAIDATAESHVAIDCPAVADTLPRWHGAGVAVPVFSIRTRDDFGAGDFASLKKMAEWCRATGQSIIQILPVNDTTMTRTWLDSYPYNANSTFALHPMYLHLQDLGELREPARREHYRRIAEELNALPEVDYERVTANKELYAREIFAQEGDAVVESEEFRRFVNENSDWLMPYAAFRVLRDRYNTAWMDDWGEYARYDAVAVARFIDRNRREVNFHCFVQFNLARQFAEARAYAHSLGVAIKGDIPIGISRTSVDAWRSPRLFNLDCQAGAPPDYFAKHGQNWGFPTYNWEEMAKDGFAWWKSRFVNMARFVDAYRIDHVLGFFRIWQIPCHSIHGLLGYFNPALPLTPAEMEQAYGYRFRGATDLSPYINEHLLTDFFGDLAQEARRFFGPGAEPTLLAPLAGYATQREVASHFAALRDDDRNRRLRDGLLDALDNVLFIEDPAHPGMYHPRIDGQYTTSYHSLPEEQRQAFDRLYEDFFYHRHNDFWREKALWKLPPLIDATEMLVCAEDLGMIPACVPDVLDRLQILTLDLQRMPKEAFAEFGDALRFPYNSVCTTSTHDMSGIRLWWETDRKAAQDFYNHVLGRSGEAPATASPELCAEIIALNLKSPSMLCILPVQDWLSTDGALRRRNPAEEVINIPAQSGHYWRYRMHLDVETLLEATAFNERLRASLLAAGRAAL